MAEKDPTKEPEFVRVLHNLLSTPHKPQSEVRAERGKPAAKPAKKKGG
jgi:hypothetical protein